jgi:hypothetical protein
LIISVIVFIIYVICTYKLVKNKKYEWLLKKNFQIR